MKLMICIILSFTISSVCYAEPNREKNHQSNYGYGDAANPLKIKKPIYPKVPKGWKLETKNFENSILLSYFDSDDDDLIMTIFEENRRLSVPVPHSEQTIINNTTYSYYPWRSTQRGWVLRWARGNVSFEMSSFSLNIDEMITIAETISRQFND